MNHKLFCSFCDRLLSIKDSFSFKECKNHQIIVHFFNCITILQNNDYSITLSPNLIELYSKETSKLILSIPNTIYITPESFDSTIQKLLSMKAFL